MRLRQLFTDDEAVSPVIGVILMVAITVILAAVIGAFVLGFGDSQSSAPSASFSSENVSDSSTEIQFSLDSSGDAIDVGNLYCGSGSNSIGSGSPSNYDDAQSDYGGDGEMTAGDYVTCTSTELIWNDGDSSSTLASHEE